MTFTSHRALQLQRDARYLIECIERKREVLGDHALDLDHAIKSLRQNCERVEEEFGRWLDECNKPTSEVQS